MIARGRMVAAAVALLGAAAHGAPLPPGSATLGKAKRAAPTGVLNLNSATLDEIDALPGISPAVAAAVVAERTARPFARPDDLLRVQGVSRRRFERLRPHLTVTGATTYAPGPRRRPGRTLEPHPGRPGRPAASAARGAPRVPAQRQGTAGRGMPPPGPHPRPVPATAGH